MITKIECYEIDETQAVEIFIPPSEKHWVFSQGEFDRITKAALWLGKGFSTQVVSIANKQRK